MKKNLMFKGILLVSATSLLMAGNPGRVDVYGIVGKEQTAKKSPLKDFTEGGARVDAYIGNDWGIRYDVDYSKNVKTKAIRTDKSKMLRYGVGAFKDFENPSRATPYISAGFGAEKVTNVTYNSLNYAKKKQAFVNAGAGVKYDLNEKWRAMTELQYVRGLDDKSSDYAIKAGLGYGFNVLAAAVIPEVVDAYQPVIEETYQPVAAPIIEEVQEPVYVEQYTEPAQVYAEVIDSDNDGIEDSQDRCQNTPSGAVVDAYGCHKSCVSYVKRVYFNTDSAQIRPEHKKDLKRVNQIMKNRPSYNANLIGRADSRASKAHNKRLSQRRAKSVKYGIVSYGGIDAGRITTEARGETDPLASNGTRRGMQKNRSVTIDLVRNGY